MGKILSGRYLIQEFSVNLHHQSYQTKGNQTEGFIFVAGGINATCDAPPTYPDISDDYLRNQPDFEQILTIKLN